MKVLILLLFTSCVLYVGDNIDVEDQEVKNILTANIEFGEKWDQLCNWQLNNIEYKTDYEVHGKKDYTQSPAETYKLRTGDCEDRAILFSYWWLKYCDIDTDIVISIGEKSSHVSVEYNGFKFMDKIKYHGKPRYVQKASKILWRYNYENN